MALPPTELAPAHWIHAPTSPLFGASESTNWSGYVDTGSVFTKVSGQWTVPAVQASSSGKYSVQWVGIDGASTSDLIQTGTDEQAVNGTTSYLAWYELLPANLTPINEPVHAGDVIQASVAEQAANVWLITIKDATAGWTSSSSYSYKAPGTSAEWIEEAPTVNGGQSVLANFSSVGFSNAQANGTSPSAAGLNPTYMVTGSGSIIAYPGPYNSTTNSFSVTYGAPVPTVTGLSVKTGTTAGGTSVVISGTGLYGVTSVSFGGVAAKFTDNPNGTVTATSPAHAAGLVTVTVSTTGGTSAAVSAGQFTYTAPTSSGGGHTLKD